jgi:aldose 1-epimerase
VSASASVRAWKGQGAVVLKAGDYEAVFLPDLGMLGSSLTHRGVELLSLHGGVAAYRRGHTTGLPLLAPWANRLSRKQFRAAGVDVDHGRLPLHRDANGLAIHGTMTAARGWEVTRLVPGRLVARIDYAADRAFPFPHQLKVDALLTRRGLSLKTSLRSTGRRRVPVSFGWHPYFRVPGPRRGWILELPRRTQWELDAKGIPTGEVAELRPERVVLGDRMFDDLLGFWSKPRILLQGRGVSVEVRLSAGYNFAQIYGPPGKRLLAIEPMTSPTDALVTDGCPNVLPGQRYDATFEVAAA